MKLYNTLSRKVEVFQPRNGNEVNFFVCGPTVYDFSHIGHAKTYVQMDILARTLRVSGYKVTYLQNITDIDDKIITRAHEQGLAWDKLAKRFEDEYYQDMVTLGIGPVQYVRATDYIAEIISQVQRLIKGGFAYKISDGIYFEIEHFKNYGKLSGRREVKADDAQTRIDHCNEKRGWNDFCLWKFSKPNEPVWEAPFGNGRPGWHIEDTAITEKIFGPQYDIHGGAIDLIFPHHEAELTQMESISNKVPFVKYWVHGGFLTVNDTKMSKSLNNFYTIREVIEKNYHPMAIRLLMLQSHYRSSINFSFENLDGAVNRLYDLWALADLKWQLKPGAAPNFPKLEILKAMQSDLASPQTMAMLSKLNDDIKPTGNLSDWNEFLNFLDQLFGLHLSDRADISKIEKQLISEREAARTAKDFTKSDMLRDKLKLRGIGVRDTDHGQIWFRELVV